MLIEENIYPDENNPIVPLHYLLKCSVTKFLGIVLIGSPLDEALRLINCQLNCFGSCQGKCKVKILLKYLWRCSVQNELLHRHFQRYWLDCKVQNIQFAGQVLQHAMLKHLWLKISEHITIKKSYSAIRLFAKYSLIFICKF